MSEESLAIASAKDPFNESRHNEMKLKPKHYQRSMNMSRAQLGKPHLEYNLSVDL